MSWIWDFSALEASSNDEDTVEACVILHEDGQHETVPLETLDPESISSLGRLEGDLQRLQAKWDEVEEILQERDQHIEELEAEADEDRNAIIALEAELRTITSEKSELAAALAEIEKLIDEQRSATKEAEFTVTPP